MKIRSDRKYLVLISIALGLLIHFLILTPGATASEKVILKVGHVQGPTTPLNKGWLRFAKRVSELSNGSIEIRLFPSAALGNERHMIEQVQLRTLEMGSFAPAYMEAIEPSVAVATIPYLYRDSNHFHHLWYAPIGLELKDKLIKKGFRALGTFDFGFRSTVTRMKPIKSLADFKGIKIRVMENPTVIMTWKLLGASPVPMPWPEVYSALGAKVIDAMEAPPVGLWAIKVQEVAKYLTLTEHQFTCNLLFIGEWAWQRLTADQRKAVSQAAIESEKFQQEMVEKNNENYIRKMVEGGLKVYKIDKKPLQDVVKPVYEEFTNKIGWPDLITRVMNVK